MKSAIQFDTTTQSVCKKCALPFVAGARFCHGCGERLPEVKKLCPVCSDPNPNAAVFCHHCGHDFEGKRKASAASTTYTPIYSVNFEGSILLVEQIKTAFFKDLRQRVSEEHEVAKLSDYLERIYSTPFREAFDTRMNQLTQGVFLQWEELGEAAFPQIDRRLGRAFEGLLDFFLIHYCRDLNGFHLPEAILKYENARLSRVDIGSMVMDFLDFPHENEKIYLDFIAMPVQKLQNACTTFLHADRRERIFFICDLSISGNCKEGFAMTDKGIYWKANLASAYQVQFGGLKDIRFNKEYLTVNGHFFNANPSLNLKLFKLLKKLRELNS